MKLTPAQLVKLMRQRTMVLQKPKVQSNKKVYKRDRNREWKREAEA